MQEAKQRKAENKRRDVIAISAFLVLVLVVWIGIFSLPQPGQKYVYGSGVFDLRGVCFADTVYVTMGYWLSYPERHYTPQELYGGAAAAPVPSYTLDYTDVQFVTHTMTLRLPVGEIFGIYVHPSGYSIRLFFDGEEVGQVGEPGITREATTPRVLPLVFVFTPETDTTTVVVHTANFVHRIGAEPPYLIIGRYPVLQQYINKHNATAIFVITCMIAAAFFHLGLFVLNRKRKTSLIFSVCCLLFGLMSSRFILEFFPDYNWQILFVVEYLIHYAVFVSSLLFLDKLHPMLFHKTVTRGYFIFAGVYAVLTLVLDSVVFSRMLIGFQFVSVLMMGYVLVMLARNLREKKIQSILSFTGFVVVALFGVNDILGRLEIFHLADFIGLLAGQDFTAPIGMIFLVFCYTLVLSMDYAETERAAMEAIASEQAIAAENAALESLSRMKSEYLANISHETKTPLAIISVNVQMAADLFESGEWGTLSENMAEDSKIITEALQEAQAAVLRVGCMADNNLWLASNQENREEMSVIEVSKLLVSSVEIRRRMIEKEGNKLILNIPDNFNARIYGNAGSLSQVIDNLLANARNHTAGGEISVSAGLKADNKDIVMISVSDTGTGIDPLIRPRIFERGVTGASGSGGTGIGLAICKNIIESHGGEIWLESERGKGTRASFTVPVYNERAGNGNE